MRNQGNQIIHARNHSTAVLSTLSVLLDCVTFSHAQWKPGRGEADDALGDDRLALQGPPGIPSSIALPLELLLWHFPGDS